MVIVPSIITVLVWALRSVGASTTLWVHNHSLKPSDHRNQSIIPSNQALEEWRPLRTFANVIQVGPDILSSLSPFIPLFPRGTIKAHLSDTHTQGPFNPSLLLQMFLTGVDRRRNQQRLFLFLCGHSQELSWEDVCNINLLLSLVNVDKVDRLRKMIMTREFLKASNKLDSVKTIVENVDHCFNVRAFNHYAKYDDLKMEHFNGAQTLTRQVTHFALSLYYSIGSFSVIPEQRCKVFKSVLRLFYPKMSHSIEVNMASFKTKRPTLQAMFDHPKMDKSWVIEHYAMIENPTGNSDHDRPRFFWDFISKGQTTAFDSYVETLKDIKLKRRIVLIVLSCAPDDPWRIKMTKLLKIDNNVKFSDFANTIKKNEDGQELRTSQTRGKFAKSQNKKTEEKKPSLGSNTALKFYELLDCLKVENIDLVTFLRTVFPYLTTQDQVKFLYQDLTRIWSGKLKNKLLKKIASSIDIETMLLYLDEHLLSFEFRQSSQQIVLTVKIDCGNNSILSKIVTCLEATAPFTTHLSEFGIVAVNNSELHSTAELELKFEGMFLEMDKTVQYFMDKVMSLCGGRLPERMKRTYDLAFDGNLEKLLNTALGHYASMLLYDNHCTAFTHQLTNNETCDFGEYVCITVIFGDKSVDLFIPGTTTCLQLYGLLFCGLQNSFLIHALGGELIQLTSDLLGFYNEVDEEWIPKYGRYFQIDRKL